MELEMRVSHEQAIMGWHCECVVTLRNPKLLSVKSPSNRHVPMQRAHCQPGLWTHVSSSQLEMLSAQSPCTLRPLLHPQLP